MHINGGADRRGTAIVFRDTLPLDNVEKVPSGWGITGRKNQATLINLYAPSGSNNLYERETFFNADLIYLLRHLPTHCIVRGDFNCVITPYDCTREYRPGKPLETLLKQYHTTDVLTNTATYRRCTIYTRTSAARFYRINFTAALYGNKIAFTDHFAMLLLVKLHAPPIKMGRGCWKLNATLLKVDAIHETFKTHWAIWQIMRRRYTDPTTWWHQYAKRRIPVLFPTESRRCSTTDACRKVLFLMYIWLTGSGRRP
jgi:hypothetical protein